MRLIFDAHLDLAWNAVSFNRDLTLPLDQMRANEAHMVDEPSRAKGTVSLPELEKAGVAVCVATLLARSGVDVEPKSSYRRTDLDYAIPSIAYAAAHGQLAYYRLLEAEGKIKFIETAEQLDEHWSAWRRVKGEGMPLGIILSMEGTDPIVDSKQAEQWWDNGLRAAGLAHYGQSQHAFGTGVDGPLSAEGRALLQQFERLGIALDVTHLSDRSMQEALDIFSGRVLASHHNCRSLVPADRQLADHQIRRLVERGAVIGMALDAWMLYPGWIRGETSPEVLSLEAVANHVDHICQIAGNANHVGIGSDLDGGFGIEQTPQDLHSIADLQKLNDILAIRGYKENEIESIFSGNWLRFFMEALPAN